MRKDRQKERVKQDERDRKRVCEKRETEREREGEAKWFARAPI